MRRRRSRFIAFRGQHRQNLISRNESLISRKLESRDSAGIRTDRQTGAAIPRRFTSSTTAKADRARRRQVRNVMKISLNRLRVCRITRVGLREKISLKLGETISGSCARPASCVSVSPSAIHPPNVGGKNRRSSNGKLMGEIAKNREARE